MAWTTASSSSQTLREHDQLRAHAKTNPLPLRKLKGTSSGPAGGACREARTDPPQNRASHQGGTRHRGGRGRSPGRHSTWRSTGLRSTSWKKNRPLAARWRCSTGRSRPMTVPFESWGQSCWKRRATRNINLLTYAKSPTSRGYVGNYEVEVTKNAPGT